MYNIKLDELGARSVDIMTELLHDVMDHKKFGHKINEEKYKLFNILLPEYDDYHRLSIEESEKVYSDLYHGTKGVDINDAKDLIVKIFRKYDVRIIHEHYKILEMIKDHFLILMISIAVSIERNQFADPEGLYKIYNEQNNLLYMRIKLVGHTTKGHYALQEKYKNFNLEVISPEGPITITGRQISIPKIPDAMMNLLPGKKLAEIIDWPITNILDGTIRTAEWRKDLWDPEAPGDTVIMLEELSAYKSLADFLEKTFRNSNGERKNHEDQIQRL